MMPLITSLLLIFVAFIGLVVVHRRTRAQRVPAHSGPIVAYGKPFARQAPDPRFRRDFRVHRQQRAQVMRAARQG